MDLNTEIIAYLTVNNIAYTINDYKTEQPIDGENAIVYWNTEALGVQPTQEQLDAAYVVWEKQQIANQNKQQASSLLQATDWTCTIDINNPQYSNPYLTNQDEFLAYRSLVRQIAVNPPSEPAIFPTVPTEIWSNT